MVHHGPMRNLLRDLVFILAAGHIVIACGGTLKDIARTVDDLGTGACELFGAENPDAFEHHVRTALPPGSPALADAETAGFDPRVLCTIKEVVQPFIDDQLRLQQSTAASLAPPD